MSNPSSTFTELVTTTWRNHSKDVKDNLSNNNALYNRILLIQALTSGAIGEFGLLNICDHC